jgi:hypothetical protein
MSIDQIIRYGGPWFSGIATTCGVLAALWIARRRRVGIPRVTLHSVSRNIFFGDAVLVQFRVVNVGEASFTVSELGWRVGFFPFRHRYFSQLPENIAGDDRVPATLASGHAAVFSIADDDATKLWVPIIKAFGKGPASLWIRSIRGVVYFAEGRRRVVRLPKTLFPRHDRWLR